MSKPTCNVADCDRPHLARGYCKRHYRCLMNNGSPTAFKHKHGTTAERFWFRVDKRGPNECWPWTGAKNDRGYGRFSINHKDEFAHRVSYELNVGPIPDDLYIDHVLKRGCTRRDCVNPAHLEPVTPAENSYRAPQTIASIHA